MTGINLDSIKNSVKGHVPMPIGKYRYYAVLIPLVEKEDGLYVLYEVRSKELKRQPGEISFPGGGIEGSETPRACALRETCEELCLEADAVEIIGELNYIVTYSNFTMYSFLGLVDEKALAASSPSRAEVEETFLVPLEHLISTRPETYKNRIAPIVDEAFPLELIGAEGGYSWREGTADVPIYAWRDEVKGKEYIIWGLTARLTQDFVRLIS